MPKRPCLGFGGRPCGRLSDAPGSRCPVHQRAYQRAIDGRRGTAWQRGYDREHQSNRAIVLARSRVCHLCHHDGSDGVDHVLPRSRGGSAALANLRPAHTVAPCPVCGVRCNPSRGNAA